MSYQKLDLIQGTPEWLEARKKRITASQVPVLFDLSPYQTRLQLAEEKTSGLEAPVDEFKQRLFQKGHDAERAGRDWVQSNLGLTLLPLVLVSSETPELMASLDGMDEEKGVIFEAKYMGRDNLKRVDSGDIPPHHLCQMQAQLKVSGAESCIYFAMDDDGNAVHHTIKPDSNYGRDIAEAAIKFMAQISRGEMPEPSERDFFTPNDPRFEELAKLHSQMKAISDQYDAMERMLLEEYGTYRRVKAGEVQITRYLQKGNVQYAKIPQLKGIDLDKYRAAPSERVRVTIKRGA